MNKRVIVTGAGGHVGSAVANLLAEKGLDVLGLDLKPPRRKNFPWRYTDLTDRDAVMRALEGADSVMHIGEIPGVWGPFSPDEVFATNIRIGSTVFQACAYLGVRRVVYASTAQVYGSWGHKYSPPEFVPLNETHPLRPNNAYSLSKTTNESYLRMIQEESGSLTGVCLRMPHVMGSWRSWEDSLQWIRSFDEPHEGYGTYLWIEDAAEAFYLAIDAEIEGLEAMTLTADDIFNLKPTADYLRGVWPDTPLPEFPSSHATWVDCGKAKRMLGWQPKRSIIQAWIDKNGPLPSP